MRRPGPLIGRVKNGGHKYYNQASADRSLFKQVLDMDIVDKTGDPGAEMRWAAVPFQEDIVLFYGMILHGWLRRVVFQNPSKMRVADVLELLALFEQGRLYFRKATPGEIFAAQESVYNAVPSIRFALPLTRNCRSNLGQHWKRPTIDPVKFPPRYARNGPKSARGVDTSEDEDGGVVAKIEDTDQF